MNTRILAASAVVLGLALPSLAQAQTEIQAGAGLQAQMQAQMEAIHAQGRIQGGSQAAPSSSSPFKIEKAQHAITNADLMSVVMPGVSSGTAVRSFIRFSNGDGTAQKATVELRDPTSGEGLYSWDTPLLPPGGTFEVAVTDIIANGTVIHNLRMPPVITAEVSGTFMGHVQHLMLSPDTGALNNVSTCGMVLMADPLSLPYVSGPGRVDVFGQLRITNATAAAAALRLTFKDNNGRTSTWTSPQIAPFGTVTRGIVDLAGLSTPALDPAARSLSVVADPAPMGVTLSYSEGLATSVTQDDFSAACMLTSSTMMMGSAGDDGDDDDGDTSPPSTTVTAPPPVNSGMTCDMGMMGTDMSGMMCDVKTRVTKAP